MAIPNDVELQAISFFDKAIDVISGIKLDRARMLATYQHADRARKKEAKKAARAQKKRTKKLITKLQ